MPIIPTEISSNMVPIRNTLVTLTIIRGNMPKNGACMKTFVSLKSARHWPLASQCIVINQPLVCNDVIEGRIIPSNAIITWICYLWTRHWTNWLTMHVSANCKLRWISSSLWSHKDRAGIHLQCTVCKQRLTNDFSAWWCILHIQQKENLVVQVNIQSSLSCMCSNNIINFAGYKEDYHWNTSNL